MMYTNEDAKQFKKELKTLIHVERIHPKVMYVALKAVYGEIHDGTQTVSKSATGNISYSSEELEKVFHYLSPERLPNWKPYKLFIPALALYNGLRMSEACQLQFENIVLLDGILCIRVEENEETGTAVKTVSSVRTIPIHPVILHLGFLKFIEDIKSGPLWPELAPDSPDKGYSYRFGMFFDHFNRKFVTQDSTKSFHSLRFNFIEKNRSEPDAIVNYDFDIFTQTGIEPLSECEVAEQVERFFNRLF